MNKSLLLLKLQIYRDLGIPIIIAAILQYRAVA